MLCNLLRNTACVYALFLSHTVLHAQDTLLMSRLKEGIPLWKTGKAVYLHSTAADPQTVLADRSWKRFDTLPDRYEAGYYWIRVYVKNDTPDSAFFDFVAPHADSVSLYTEDRRYAAPQRSGPYVKARDWVLPEYPELVYARSDPGTATDVLLRFSGADGRPFSLQSVRVQPRQRTLHEVVEGYRAFNSRTEFNGYFLGAVSVMMIFFLFLYFRIREKSLLYYSLYLLGATLYSLVVKSLPYSELARLAYMNFELTYKLGEPVQYFFFAAYVWFAKHLLDIDKRYGALYHSVRILAMILAAAGLALLFANFTGFDYRLQQKAYVVSRSVILPVSLILIFWVAWKVKSPVKWFFIAGSSLFIAGGILAFLMDPKSRHLFFEATLINPVVAFKSGILLESICFALALGYKLRLIRNEKEKATRDYVGQLELNRRLVATENERLEKMVSERTEEVMEKNRQLESHRQQQLQSEFQKQLADVEMQALRSQMNPHFVFNSLNSIRYQILTRKYEEAEDYLMRFAKLLRQILQNSRAHVIPLSEEIELTGLYLQMEQLRFGDNFEYQVLVDPMLDTDGILIPPMLFQPYVENALKHGLAGSPRLPKRISISLSLMEEGNRYEIEDNGIGRKAAEFPGVTTEKTGLGLKITNERIALFNTSFRHHIRVSFEDLTDEEGKAAGTKVVIIHSQERQAAI